MCDSSANRRWASSNVAVLSFKESGTKRCVLDAFGGNLTIVGTGASTADQHAPHFADGVQQLTMRAVLTLLSARPAHLSCDGRSRPLSMGCIGRFSSGYVDVCRNSARVPHEYNCSGQSLCEISTAYQLFQTKFLRKVHRDRPAHFRKDVAEPR